MAEAARKRGYDYVGISDHSQSLKIARGVSDADLWEQIRYIDKLAERPVARLSHSQIERGRRPRRRIA
jgi:histidinol phosphatase-like PHP family hydrolase